jgi:predicted Zn-dependent peptidase
MESNSRRLERFMRHYLSYGEIYSLEESIIKIEAISKDDLQNCAKKYFDISQFASVTMRKKSA